MYNYNNAAVRKAQREARRQVDDADRVARHSAYAIEAIERLHGPDIDITPEDFSSVVLATDLTHGGYDREEAAAHEVGHCVALEWVGLPMRTATIRGPNGGWRGWGGKTLCSEPMAGFLSVPINSFRQAVVCVAGPITGETHGGGRAVRHMGELMGARLYANHGATRMGMSPDEGWAEVVRMAVALTVAYSQPIAALTDELYRRKCLTRSAPPVSKLLGNIKPRELISVLFTANEEALVREVLSLTPCVDDIIQRAKARAARQEAGE